jgi:MFS family permease
MPYAQASERNKILRWYVCLAGSLFFLYQLIQENIFNSISLELSSQYNLNSTHLGLLSSSYFYATIIFILPAGYIVDRYSTRKIIIGILTLCLCATAIFALSGNLILATVCRFISGVGGAFCFLSNFKLISRWFAKEELGFVTGILVTIGMIGGFLSQTPFALLNEYLGWRQAMLFDVFLGIIVLLIIYFFVRDYPLEKKDILEMSYAGSPKLPYTSIHNWLYGMYTCLLNLPIVLLGALWGNLYLQEVHRFSNAQSSFISSMLFIGTIIGSPIMGFISDYLRNRKIPMLIGVILSIITILFIINIKKDLFLLFMLLFFLLGFFTSSQILGYPAAAIENPLATASTSASIVSFTVMCGYIIFQPLFGFVLDLSSHYFKVANSYQVALNYKVSMSLIPFGFAIALIALIFIKK